MQDINTQRTHPSTSDLIQLVSGAVEAHIKEGEPFTAYTITSALRRDHVDTEIDHMLVRKCVSALYHEGEMGNCVRDFAPSPQGYSAIRYTPAAVNTAAVTPDLVPDIDQAAANQDLPSVLAPVVRAAANQDLLSVWAGPIAGHIVQLPNEIFKALRLVPGAGLKVIYVSYTIKRLVPTTLPDGSDLKVLCRHDKGQQRAFLNVGVHRIVDSVIRDRNPGGKYMFNFTIEPNTGYVTVTASPQAAALPE